MPGYSRPACQGETHGERAAVFDGNVRRVLSRLAAADVSEAPPPRGNPGDYNQALLELGQRVCSFRAPKCDECPIAADCKARAAGLPERWPSKKPKKDVPHKEVAIGVIWDGNRFYVQRREEDGLLGGLWEFPGGKREKGETFEQCLRREIREETGFQVEVGPYLTTVKHRYSHFSVELHTYHCFLVKGEGPGKWVTLEEVEKLAMPKANLRILEEIRRTGRPLPLICR